MSDFILQSYIEDLSICDDLIELHKNSEYKVPGSTNMGINTDNKISTDVYINPVYDGRPVINKYIQALRKPTDDYIEKYKYINEFASWAIVEPFQIQHYKPGEGYFAWHTERTNMQYPTAARHLVFMTYLNDVTDDGETEFYYQKTKIQPRKGLTLMWPVDWTHTHRGITSPTQEKYVVTGWFSFTR